MSNTSNKIIDANGNVYANSLFVTNDFEISGASLVTSADLANINIVAGSGLTGGGPINANVTLNANVQSILDQLTSTKGSILYRGTAAWEILTPGSSGQVLQSNGPNTNPSWTTSSGSTNIQTLLDGISTTRGTILFRGATTWSALSPGSSGNFLRTNGAGADPSWSGVASLTRPSVVQYASSSGNSGTVTLSSAPTPGNLLVCVASHYQNVTPTGVSVGWNILLNRNGVTTDGNFIATKIADSSDSAVLSVYGDVAGCNITIFEVQNAFGVVVLPWKDIQEQTGSNTTTLNVGIPSASSLLIGAFATVSANSSPLGITGATAGTTVTGTSLSASPRQITPFINSTVSKGNQTVTATYSGSPRSYGYAVVALPSV